MSEIKANANTGLTLEKAFTIMDKLAITAQKASDTANLSWASVVLVGRKAHIKASEIAERYGLTKDYINLIQRGALLLDTGKVNKDGVPMLGKSPFAITETVKDKNGKEKAVTRDYTIQKLSRLSSLGDTAKIKDFIFANNITPDTPTNVLIKKIAEWKNPKPAETEAPETEAPETEAPEAPETEALEAETITDKASVFEVAYKALQACKLESEAPEAWDGLIKEFLELTKGENLQLTEKVKTENAE